MKTKVTKDGFVWLVVPDDVSRAAVVFADALITELKKGVTK